MEHNTINNMKKALLIVCLFISVIASGQGNFFWSHNSSGGYGLLYNWYAATSTDKITSSDDWVVPSDNDYIILINYINDPGNEGIYLKQQGLIRWAAYVTPPTNSTGFSIVGSGARTSAGLFTSIKTAGVVGTTTSYSGTSWKARTAASAANYFASSGNLFAYGFALRLLYIGTGSPTQYIGNNGYVYRVVQIGTQYWLAQNLRETKWRNGTDIPNVTDNAAWSALTTPAWCVYDNNNKYR